jgi:hypothetical protein
MRLKHVTMNFVVRYEDTYFNKYREVEWVEVCRRFKVGILLRVYQVMKQAEIETRVGDLGYA